MAGDAAEAAALAAQQPRMLAGVLPGDQEAAQQLVGDIQLTLERCGLSQFWVVVLVGLRRSRASGKQGGTLAILGEAGSHRFGRSFAGAWAALGRPLLQPKRGLLAFLATLLAAGWRAR